MNYLDFFGLKEDPFKITPDYTYFYESLTHRTAKNLLKFVVESGEGFCVIVGEPGTGKTTTLRKFISELPENYIYALILNPNLKPEEFLKALLDEFKISYDEDINKNEMLKKLRNFLQENVLNKKKVLIIIDEAQLMPIETLEELRLLSNLETEKEKLIQILLVGQPEFEETLQNRKLRQLNSRISNRMFLNFLNEKEVEKYINHRLKVSGLENLKIDPKVYKEVYKYSEGIPRLINLIMSRALMAAAMEGSFTIEPKHINPDDIGTDKVEKSKKKIVYFVILLLDIIAIIAIAAYIILTF